MIVGPRGHQLLEGGRLPCLPLQPLHAFQQYYGATLTVHQKLKPLLLLERKEQKRKRRIRYQLTNESLFSGRKSRLTYQLPKIRSDGFPVIPHVVHLQKRQTKELAKQYKTSVKEECVCM